MTLIFSFDFFYLFKSEWHIWATTSPWEAQYKLLKTLATASTVLVALCWLAAEMESSVGKGQNLVGAVDQGTSSTRFLVGCILYHHISVRSLILGFINDKLCESRITVKSSLWVGDKTVPYRSPIPLPSAQGSFITWKHWRWSPWLWVLSMPLISAFNLSEELFYKEHIRQSIYKFHCSSL